MQVNVLSGLFSNLVFNHISMQRRGSRCTYQIGHINLHMVELCCPQAIWYKSLMSYLVYTHCYTLPIYCFPPLLNTASVHGTEGWGSVHPLCLHIIDTVMALLLGHSLHTLFVSPRLPFFASVYLIQLFVFVSD